VIVFLTWLYLSAYVLLLGAEVNAELERQTMADTTVGPPMPIGQRGASVADHLAGSDGTIAKDRSNSGPSRGPELVAAGFTSRGASVLGLERAGKLPVILTTVGLAALRREGRAGLGVLLLGIGGGIAWLGRRSGDRPTKGAADRISRE